MIELISNKSLCTMTTDYTMGGSPGDVREVLVVWGDATQGLENEQSPFLRFSYVTPQMSRAPSVASATSHLKWAEPLPSLQLRHTSNEQCHYRRFSYVNLIIQSFRSVVYLRHKHFTYVSWRGAHGLGLLLENCRTQNAFCCLVIFFVDSSVTKINSIKTFNVF